MRDPRVVNSHAHSAEETPRHARQRDHAVHHTEHTSGHDKHAGHSPEMFRDRLVLSVLLTLPILYYSDQVQQWLGYQPIRFPGSEWLTPVLSVVIYFYGGWVFVRGAADESAARSPGMMTLVALAISVAFVYSLAVTMGLQGMPFYWELATLIDVMLLGHWMEMLSIQGASKALGHLAALIPPDRPSCLRHDGGGCPGRRTARRRSDPDPARRTDPCRRDRGRWDIERQRSLSHRRITTGAQGKGR